MIQINEIADTDRVGNRNAARTGFRHRQEEKLALKKRTPSNPDKDEVIKQWLEHHQSKLDLCFRLESLADNLPDNYDRQECLSISWQIYPIIREAHKFEEEILFPFLSIDREEVNSLLQSLERLKYEHWEDECYAEEISLSLRQMISDPAKANIEKIAYMLRGFFEGMRRHIAFENEHLLPMIHAID